VGTFGRSVSSKRSKKFRVTTAMPYAAIAVVVIGILSVGYRPEQQNNVPLGSVGAQAQSQSSSSNIDAAQVDQVSAANIAASAAQLADMSVGANVQNLATTLTMKSELGQLDDTTVAKPQMVSKTSNRGIISYTTAPGDTVSSVAAQYGLSGDTVRWANNLTGDTLDTGKTITFPAVDGVLYTVKAGDTALTLATKYKSDADRIISYNDAEVSGLKTGQQVVVPSGVLPENERPGYIAPIVFSGTTYSGYSSSTDNGSVLRNMYRQSVGNRYAAGNCTWYAYERRAELGRPIGSFWGNASSWAVAAASAGYIVNKTPEVGAIIQNGGGAGHVAIVEGIKDNGDLTLSEMNYAGGFNKVTWGRVIPASSVASYNYIH
jgi:surface antigen